MTQEHEFIKNKGVFPSEPPRSFLLELCQRMEKENVELQGTNSELLEALETISKRGYYEGLNFCIDIATKALPSPCTYSTPKTCTDCGEAGCMMTKEQIIDRIKDKLKRLESDPADSDIQVGYEEALKDLWHEITDKEWGKS